MTRKQGIEYMAMVAAIRVAGPDHESLGCDAHQSQHCVDNGDQETQHCCWSVVVYEMAVCMWLVMDMDIWDEIVARLGEIS